jgi:DNA polymerase V
MQRAIALVDCNNFYVSCERLFQPKLKSKPVVVLSNNDGCVVSRSQEVKDLGISMALPWYQMRALAKQHGIVALSSNYSLYADLSHRVMSLLAGFSPRHEVYSIDESFLELSGITCNLTLYAQQIRQTIARSVGIPVCVGIAPSKTLAKLANHVAKKNPRFNSVCNFNRMSTHELDALFSAIEVGEIWGVGRRSKGKLNAMGINSVLDLKHCSPKLLRSKFSVVFERIVEELNGTACLALDEVAPAKQQIICSRSFGSLTSCLSDLEQAVVNYTTRAAEKLRQQQSVAGGIQVYIRTNPHRVKEPQYEQMIFIPLHETSNDTRVLCQATLYGLRQIYQRGYAYQKVGVMLTQIIPIATRATTLFDDAITQHKSQALMATLDLINRKMGSDTVKLLGAGIKPTWEMRRQNVSNRYTTEWTELAVCFS